MLYEAKPYLLLTSSGCCLVGASYSAYPLFLTTAACLLFYTGSVIWMLRSRHRRRDQHPQERRQLNRTQLFPFYEWKPFLLLAAGATLPTLWSDLVIFLLAGILCATGILLLIVRARYRSRSWRHLIQEIADNDKPIDNPYAVVRKACLGKNCGIHDYCQSLPLPIDKISECMRLLQYMEPKHVALQVKDHGLTEQEFLSVLTSLQQQSVDCATWSKKATPKS